MATETTDTTPEAPIETPVDTGTDTPIDPIVPVVPRIPAVLRWPALTSPARDSFELTIPDSTIGRIEVYAVPISEAAPDGYFLSVNTGSFYTSVEPGCAAWEKTLLVRVQLGNTPTGEVMSGSLSTSRHHILEYVHDTVQIDIDALNPVQPAPVDPVPDPVAAEPDAGTTNPDTTVGA